MTTGGRLRRAVAKRSSPFAKWSTAAAGYDDNATGAIVRDAGAAAATTTKACSTTPDSQQGAAAKENALGKKQQQEVKLSSSNSILCKRSREDRDAHDEDADDTQVVSQALDIVVKNTRSTSASNNNIGSSKKEVGSVAAVANATTTTTVGSASAAEGTHAEQRRSKRQRKTVTKFQNDEGGNNFTNITTKALSSDAVVSGSGLGGVPVLNRTTKLLDHLLEKHADVYAQSPRTKYVVVAMSVLAKFKKKGGRFVEKNYRKHQVKVVGDRQILPWIMQALSDRAAHHNKAREGERSAVPPPLSILPRAKLQVVAAPAVLPPSRPSASPEASSPASEERRSSSSRRSSSNNDANTNDRRPVDRDQHRRRCRAAAAWSNASTASLSQPDNDEPEESDTDYDPKDKNFKKKKARTKKATPPTAMPMPMLHHPDGRPVNSLNDNDVLMGKGPQFSLYPGNFFFREVVRQHREMYNSTTEKMTKSICIKKVIDAVHALDPPGRFLEFAADGTLTEAPYQRVYLKTSQALRDSKRVWTDENRLVPRSFLEWNAEQTAPNQQGCSQPQSNAGGSSALSSATAIPAEEAQPASSSSQQMTAQHSISALKSDLPAPQEDHSEALLDTKPSARTSSRTKSRPPLESEGLSPGPKQPTSMTVRVPFNLSKRRALSNTRVRLPSKASLAKAGLPEMHVPGPRRTKEQEGPVIKEPHVHDVLFGRGPNFCTHLGNIRYRKIVWENKEMYSNMRRGPKSALAHDIINTIRSMDPPGRFLEYDEYEKRWEEAPMPRMVDKICQALRSKWGDQSSAGPMELCETNLKRMSDEAPESKSSNKSPAKRKKYVKHPMISRVRVKLPTPASLAELGLPDSRILGPPRFQKHEGPLIKEPHIHDVLFGRGPTFMTHQANVRYRRIIWENRKTYALLDRGDKKSFATDIINTIRNMDPPGRFLEYIEDSEGWRVAPMDRVVTKTLAALRDLRQNGCPKAASVNEDATQKSEAKLLSREELVSSDGTTPAKEALTNADRPTEPYPKHEMISKIKIKLPSDTELIEYGLPCADDVGPPRLQSQEGPRILEPHSHDVLFGRGPGPCSHPGNLRYRRLVWANKETYAAMKDQKKHKSAFATDLMNTIRNLDPPGRFLEFNADTEVFEVAPMPRIINKILQALRESKWGPDPVTEISRTARPKLYPSQYSKMSANSTAMLSEMNRSNTEAAEDHSDPGFSQEDASVSDPDSSSWPHTDDIYNPEVASKIKLGSKLAIYWPLDETHYVGEVMDKQKTDVLIRYEDDELVEWVDLTRHSFRVLDDGIADRESAE